MEKQKRERYERKLAEAEMRDQWNSEQINILRADLETENDSSLERGKAMRQKLRDNTENPVNIPVKKGKTRSVRKFRGKVRRKGRDKSRRKGR